jgi:Replicative DNA helicase
MNQRYCDEMCVIGCCMLGGLDTAIEAIESVPADAFSQMNIREIFGIIERLATSGEPITEMTLRLKWKESNSAPFPEDIMKAPDMVPSAFNLPYYVGPIIEAWKKDRIVRACRTVWEHGQIETVSSDALLAEAESVLYAEEITGVTTVGAKEASDILINDLERRHQLQGKLSGIETPFKRFNELTDGLQYGEQSIIGARPSQGKTAISLNIVEHACFVNKIPTLFVTLEMGVASLMRRLASSWTEIPLWEIRRGSYTPQQFSKFTSFKVMEQKAPFWIIDAVGGIGLNKLSAAVRRRVRKDKVKLVVIDYLQKIKPSAKHEKRTYEVGEVSTQLKSLAVQTEVALLTLAQLNRESEKEKTRPPRLSDLADSGQIERDGDMVALIHRDRHDNTGATKLIVAKQRDGDTGVVSLTFAKELVKFKNP